LTFFPALAIFAAMGQARDFPRPGLASGMARAAVRIGIDHGWSMLPLTVDDLLPLEEYASRRKEFFDSHRRYVDRYRRVRVGPRLTLIFENRQTLWYRVHEVIRVARLADSDEVQQELNLYNRLLPGQGLLQAALLIEIADMAEFVKELAPWQDLCGDQLELRVESMQFPAHLVTCRPEDRCIGTAHWVQFAIPAHSREQLTRFELPAFFHFDNGRYQHQSAELSEDLRQSLLEDLEMSDRADPRVAG
jgi:hypothetical protein